MNKLSIKDNILYKYIVYILIFIYYKIIKYNFFSYIKFVNCFFVFLSIKKYICYPYYYKILFFNYFQSNKKTKKTLYSSFIKKYRLNK
jgi:hypothetical protein